MNINRRLINSKFIKPLIKVGLNLSVLFGLAFLIAYSYQLFTAQFVDPLRASILLILEFTLWLIIVILSRSRSRHYWLRYKGTKPNFKLTTLSVVAILLVFTFAGVQPMSTYKDGLIESYKISQAEQVTKRAVAEAEAEKEKAEAEAKAEEERVVAVAETEAEAEIAIYEAERLAFTLINMYREENGIPTTLWDDELYKLSKAHTQEMADSGEIFHGSGNIIGENAWGGSGFAHYSSDDLAMEIVVGWVSSPLHNAWLLHAPIKESCVSIINTGDGQYASWTFWMNRLNSGPDLVERTAKEWRSSGSDLDWIPWLESKGYL